MFARVKLVCPVCGMGLSYHVMNAETNKASWSLTESSTTHLAEAHA